MADDFHEVQFPTDISYESSGGPEFSTEVIELGSGHERRNQNWTYARQRWNVGYGVREKGQLDSLRAFFYARKGRAYGFRFKDHDDYQATGEELGTGDGSETEFQLIKTYSSGGESYERKITKPVSGTVTIYIDSVEQASGWSVDTTTGIVTFSSPPTSGEVITADFDFDIPVRFESDYLPVNLSSYQARAADVILLELKS
ncbi:MAG TPA: TIGR02217 family protein [candidate division Zixibacteria bacterium]|nr:TIGR02217 family protein [candidate division Zixibacteria bacterium]